MPFELHFEPLLTLLKELFSTFGVKIGISLQLLLLLQLYFPHPFTLSLSLAFDSALACHPKVLASNGPNRARSLVLDLRKFVIIAHEHFKAYLNWQLDQMS